MIIKIDHLIFQVSFFMLNNDFFKELDKIKINQKSNLREHIKIKDLKNIKLKNNIQCNYQHKSLEVNLLKIIKIIIF